MKYLVPQEVGNVYFSKANTIYLYSVIIPIFFIDFNRITTSLIAVNILLLVLTVCIGHSIGLHRGIIHKTYKTSKIFQNILVYLFVLTGLGSPKNWIKMHYYRDFWQNKKDCPKYFKYNHTILLDFYWNLHTSFVPKNEILYEIPNTDLNDTFIKFLHKTWIFHILFWFILLLLTTNLNTALFIINFRIAITIVGHWFIGYVSHKYGYAHYEIEHADESAYNNLILGYLSFGEGFHNNHHAFPKSAKLGLKWYEFDLGWYIILFFKKINLIQNVQQSIKKETTKEIKLKYNFPIKL